MRLTPYWIPHFAGADDFPPVEQALKHPDGLLAVGGDLTPKRLLVAYRKGIFPWYSEDQPILWWSPSRRMVLFPEHLKVSRSLRKTLNKPHFTVTLDQDFRAVIAACAGPRRKRGGTWITPDMMEAYYQLHRAGFAHSVECWQEKRLVGGLYGVALGKIFCGESMFSCVTDASKVAFVHLVRQLQRWGFELIDCQVHTHHLESLGAVMISRQEFCTLLKHLVAAEEHTKSWHFDSVDGLL